MKAKEFQKYQNYALSIRITDLDHEIEFVGDNLSMKWVDAGGGSKISEPLTDEDRELLWNKEVISFDMCQSNISWGDGRGPKILSLSVSRFTEEERRQIDKELAIKKAKEELERLSGKTVEFGKEIEKDTLNGNGLVFGTPFIIKGDKVYE